jgi:hypothetical protein
VTSGPGSKRSSLRSLPTSALRLLGGALGFVVLIAAVFAGVGLWQDRDPAPDTAAEAPEPVPPPAPVPAPSPGPDPVDPTAPDGEDPDTPDDSSDTDTPVPAPADGPRPETVSVQLLNGIGPDGATGVASVRTLLAEAGFRIVASNAGRAYDRTTVFYTVGFEAEGRLVAQALGTTEVFAMTELPADRRLSASVMVHVVVGADRR